MPEWKALIAIEKQNVFVKKGQTIFSEGDQVTGIYFVYSGAVKVHQSWGSEKELIVRFAAKGDLLGHRGLVKQHTYPVSATALDDTLLCYITQELLEATFKTNPAFTYVLMQQYAMELQQAEQRMRNLALMEVKGRVAETLLTIESVFGKDKEKYISIPVTRQDIASHAGTTYETVFKLFNELTAQKIIATEGKRIKISKPGKLKELVGNG
ncbi:Crp/Fnr family transcriptional regulator [Deminuibacter soli]|nr:Crp/Fnr family transcriptional regulator [Deminuibacter soli]